MKWAKAANKRTAMNHPFLIIEIGMRTENEGENGQNIKRIKKKTLLRETVAVYK